MAERVPSVIVVSTAAYDEIAAKLRKLDRFDVLVPQNEAMALGDVIIMRLRPAVDLTPR